MRNTTAIEEVRKSQLELGLARNRNQSRGQTREQQVQRANWWFAQMRQVVDRAIDWQATPPAPTEQG